MQKLTIKEIAKLAGVSPAAVSIVLNDRKGVSDETRRKVAEIVDKLQYTPNPSSRRLLFNKTDNIAVLFKKSISPLEQIFYSELNGIIMNECEALGYNLIFTSARVDRDTVVLPNVIKARDVDGILFYGDPDQSLLNAIRKFDIPYIIIDSHLPGNDVLCVKADYDAAAYKAASHLLELGHKEIAYIGNNNLPNHNSQTFSGFRKAVEERQLSIPVNWIRFEAYDEKAAYECMKNILQSPLKPAAVFCSADIYAIGAIKCIKEKGISIPESMSVIGIDDILLSQYVEPALTTVRINKVEMAKIAMELLIKRIGNENVNSRTIKVDTLMIRSSTATSKT